MYPPGTINDIFKTYNFIAFIFLLFNFILQSFFSIIKNFLLNNQVTWGFFIGLISYWEGSAISDRNRISSRNDFHRSTEDARNNA